MESGAAGRWRPILVGPSLVLASIGLFALWSVALTFGDWRTARHLDRAGVAARGTVLEYDSSLNAATVSYVRPGTGTSQIATTDIWDHELIPEPGDVVALRVDAERPESVKLAGDHYPLIPLVTASSLVPAAFPAVLLALRSRHARRAERLARDSGPTYRVLGRLTARERSRRGRLQLALYPLDDPNGVGPPLAVVPLLARTTSYVPLPLGQLTPMDAKGQIRPLGLIVAQANGWIAWPEASALPVERSARRTANRAVSGNLAPR